MAAPKSPNVDCIDNQPGTLRSKLVGCRRLGRKALQTKHLPRVFFLGHGGGLCHIVR
jgi:hypothetical protein